jgi:glycosyltransferase involved in cell wall biosynthesis
MDQALNPKISVLMPVYNCASYIAESVDSILTQTYEDFELILIDDCSSDGTAEYLESLSDPRIKFIRKPQNTGLTNSLNMGLEIACGEYIARMDGDDISLPDRFGKQVEFMDSNPDVVVCGTFFLVIGSEDKFTPNLSNDSLVMDLMINSPIAHPTVFIRNSVIKANHIRYDPVYESAEDYKMWTVLSEYGALANVSEILLHYRIHPEQTTNRRAKTQGELAKKIAFEYTKRISGDHDNIRYFCEEKLRNTDDVLRYDEVERDVIANLLRKGIQVDRNFFEKRKNDYLKFSLLYERNSLHQFGRDLKFIYLYRKHLGWYFISKLLVKSLLFWRP